MHEKPLRTTVIVQWQARRQREMAARQEGRRQGMAR
jgi:hypothetical protein